MYHTNVSFQLRFTLYTYSTTSYVGGRGIVVLLESQRCKNPFLTKSAQSPVVDLQYTTVEHNELEFASTYVPVLQL